MHARGARGQGARSWPTVGASWCTSPVAAFIGYAPVGWWFFRDPVRLGWHPPAVVPQLVIPKTEWPEFRASALLVERKSGDSAMSQELRHRNGGNLGVSPKESLIRVSPERPFSIVREFVTSLPQMESARGAVPREVPNLQKKRRLRNIKTVVCWKLTCYDNCHPYLVSGLR